MYSRIVVPLDGSDLAETAQETAITFSRTFDAPIHVLHVVDTQALEQLGGSAESFNYSMLADMYEAETGDAREYISKVVSRLEADGLAVTSDLRVGPVASTILAELRDGDLVVMASHGRTGIRRWVLGSVAEEITRHAEAPVLLVKQPHLDQAT